jgi:dTDP-4-amino-4,6-dideoxygalactose transaminase/acetyltransferase-like isoleucine patch superfamily enzyme
MAKTFIHDTAVVDAGVTLGDGARIWHFVHVSEGASIGPRTSLGQNVFIGKGVRVGAGVKVQNNVSLYEGVVIEDDVFLGPSAVFTNVINPRAFVERKHEYRVTRVGRGASIGANATILCGTQIGEYAFVAAAATVTRDVAPYALVVGSPAKRTGWMCRCAKKLGGSGDVTCSACGARYQLDALSCVPRTGEPPETPVPMLDVAAQNGPLMTEYRATFERVMNHGQFILGSEVDAFEARLRDSFGFKHALAVSSGTDALLLALMALDIAEGDEVITSAFSFFATAGCIARVGAKPVFVDIDPATYNMDPEKIEKALSPRTKAILPVHLFGQSADMEALQAIAEARQIPIIEDAAQALGATFKSRYVGTLGAFGCFSFFPSKNLGGFGDAGLLTTERDDLAERARVLRTHGSRTKYFHEHIGGNFRIDALQAALLSVKLPHLARYTAERRHNANSYDRAFAARGLAPPLLTTPRRGDHGHVYNQYVIRTPRRDALKQALTRAGIASEIYYPLGLHMQPCFAKLGYKEGDLPETERACRELLAIPVYGELPAADRERIVETVASALQAHAKTC